MAVAPIPIVLPLAGSGPVPVGVVATMLLPIYPISLRLVIVPLVVILVLLVVIAVLVGMIAPVVVAMLGLRKQAIRKKESCAK